MVPSADQGREGERKECDGEGPGGARQHCSIAVVVSRLCLSCRASLEARVAFAALVVKQTASHQPPAASRQPPATSHQPPAAQKSRYCRKTCVPVYQVSEIRFIR